MGRAWKAFDRHLNKYVVIKTIVTQDDMLRDELRKEAEFLINVRHPNILAVSTSLQSKLNFAMSWNTSRGPVGQMKSKSQSTVNWYCRCPAEQALNRVKGLLPAFKYLHGLNPPIIYCDFKPSNVKTMTLSNGEQIEVLLDFGTAYRYDPDIPPKPARGTPGYHSPQAAHPDWRDDYFTIGLPLPNSLVWRKYTPNNIVYTLTPADQFPWTQYDVSLRYLVELLTAP
jgi:serine/threonine protein kinase